MTAVAPAVVSVNAAQAVTVAVAPAVRMVSSSNSGDEQVLSSNSSPTATAAAAAAAVVRTTTLTTTPELLEENERLRKENAQLNQELNRLRSLCNNVYNLMSNFTVNPSDMTAGIPEGRALELLRTGQIAAEVDGGATFTAGESSGVKAEEDMSPRLFGVSIGVKRVRRSNEEESERVQDQVQPHGSDVKSEPLDSGSAHHDDQPWIDRLG